MGVGHRSKLEHLRSSLFRTDAPIRRGAPDSWRSLRIHPKEHIRRDVPRERKRNGEDLNVLDRLFKNGITPGQRKPFARAAEHPAERDLLFPHSEQTRAEDRQRASLGLWPRGRRCHSVPDLDRGVISRSSRGEPTGTGSAVGLAAFCDRRQRKKGRLPLRPIFRHAICSGCKGSRLLIWRLSLPRSVRTEEPAADLIRRMDQHGPAGGNDMAGRI